jgi:protocatechuate 3,4-dioxygenase alpha subunit
VTRVYFADEATANEADPVLATMVEPERRPTLVAMPTDDGYRFDIRLQGEGETVFLAI